LVRPSDIKGFEKLRDITVSHKKKIDNKGHCSDGAHRESREEDNILELERQCICNDTMVPLGLVWELVEHTAKTAAREAVADMLKVILKNISELI